MEEHMRKERVIPKKNYVYLLLLTVGTFFVLFCFVKWYRLREQEQATRVIQISAATQIHVKELSNYLLENPDVIVYLSDSTNESLTTFENNFENYLHNKELLSKMIYIDTSSLTEDERYKIEKEWYQNGTLIEPNFIIISSGKKVGQLYTANTEIKLSDVHQFLTQYEVVE